MELILNNGMKMLINQDDYEKFCRKTVSLKCRRKKYFYTEVCYKGKTHPLHRLIMDAPKGKMVDHINRNTLDNRKENLRICEHWQNRANSFVKGKNYRCIHWDKHKGKWRLRIMRKGKDTSFGSFTDLNEAIKKYNEVAKEFYGEFTAYSELQNP